MQAIDPSVTFLFAKSNFEYISSRLAVYADRTAQSAMPHSRCLPAIACITTLLSIYSTLPHPTFYHENNSIRFACENIEKQCQPTSFRRNQHTDTVQHTKFVLNASAFHRTRNSRQPVIQPATTSSANCSTLLRKAEHRSLLALCVQTAKRTECGCCGVLSW